MVYPNPANNNIYIKVGGPLLRSKLGVFDAGGDNQQESDQALKIAWGRLLKNRLVK